MILKMVRKLLGYEDKFFDLLEASAVEAKVSVQLLVKMLEQPADAPDLESFIKSRRKDKRLTEEITEELCKTFVTPLEREDIESLSRALYKIPKIVEKFSEKFILCQPHVRGVDFSRQIVILNSTTDTVAEMVAKLRSKTHLEQMKDLNANLQRLENEADKVMMDLVKELYSGRYEPLQVIIILDLYETLEKIIDRCRDAGNVIFQIVLKYS